MTRIGALLDEATEVWPTDVALAVLVSTHSARANTARSASLEGVIVEATKVLSDVLRGERTRRIREGPRACGRFGAEVYSTDASNGFVYVRTQTPSNRRNDFCFGATNRPMPLDQCAETTTAVRSSPRFLLALG